MSVSGILIAPAKFTIPINSYDIAMENTRFSTLKKRILTENNDKSIYFEDTIALFLIMDAVLKTLYLTVKHFNHFTKKSLVVQVAEILCTV